MEPIAAAGLSFAVVAQAIHVRLHDEEGAVVAVVRLSPAVLPHADNQWRGCYERLLDSSPSEAVH
jgi:hypothetical protein